MPFRSDTSRRKPLTHQRRTGEPSLAKIDYESLFPEGYGKAHGSYTEKVRNLLLKWVKNKSAYLVNSQRLCYSSSIENLEDNSEKVKSSNISLGIVLVQGVEHVV